MPTARSRNGRRFLGFASMVLMVAVSFADARANEPPRYSDAYDRSWAVVIGIDAYQKTTHLNYAVADAKAVAAVLPNLGFPPENTRVLLDGDATKTRIEATFYRDLASKMGPNDRLLIYFAGHGETAPT